MKMTLDIRARLSLRIPEQLDKALKRQAKLECRSQNALISEILQDYIEKKTLQNADDIRM